VTTSLEPSVGRLVLHLFCHRTGEVNAAAIRDAVKRVEAEGDTVVPVAMLGHKADIAFMVLSSDVWRLRTLQSELQSAGLSVGDSYVSMTELSEYAKGVPEEMRNARLYPDLPPEGKNAWCFYPMSKRRGDVANWFTLPYDERKELMYEHGASGRKFAGRVLQVVTGSAGVDDFEWGVTLFAVHPDDLKEVVYTMRFDRASAEYADFGAFYTGVVGTLDEVLASVGLDA
jgi:hydrogen peroxide-dependent heme synthase